MFQDSNILGEILKFTWHKWQIMATNMVGLFFETYMTYMSTNYTTMSTKDGEKVKFTCHTWQKLS